MKNNISYLLILISFTLGACAAFKPKLDEARAQKVKKMVILSMEVQQKQPKDAFSVGRLSETSARRADSKELQGMAKKIYEHLANKIEGKTSWTVLPYNQLVKSKAYEALYQKKMTGFRQVSITTENTEIIHPEGVLDNTAFRNLSYEEKVALARSIGADAFAEYMAYQTIDQGISFGNLTGEASFQFTNRSNLMIYGLDSEEPIWRVQNIDGDKTSESDELPEKLSVLQKLSRLGYQSAQSSIDRLVNHYSL